ncbi:unnamed protein product [Diabrotica balteata]|uniref:Cadherin domain-containing protein n=1 Tax=Diabrotica balteata TaxID=107213 RepID=A0A9N9SU87_DIABA|nr:unnamed protein product [Diabrotica balteata]
MLDKKPPRNSQNNNKTFQEITKCFQPKSLNNPEFLQVQITVLDKNDSPPSFKDAPLHFSVSEDLGPGQSIATIKAEDPDTIGTLDYSLLKGDDGKFSLDKTSGVLRLIDSLDRETKDVYKLLVRCSDGNQFTDTIVSIETN